MVCTLGCGAEVRQEDLFRHIDEECPLRPMSCEACGLQVPHRDMQNHLAERCSRAPRRCTNGEIKWLMSWTIAIFMSKNITCAYLSVSCISTHCVQRPASDGHSRLLQLSSSIPIYRGPNPPVLDNWRLVASPYTLQPPPSPPPPHITRGRQMPPNILHSVFPRRLAPLLPSPG